MNTRSLIVTASLVLAGACIAGVRFSRELSADPKPAPAAEARAGFQLPPTPNPAASGIDALVAWLQARRGGNGTDLERWSVPKLVKCGRDLWGPARGGSAIKEACDALAAKLLDGQAPEGWQVDVRSENNGSVSIEFRQNGEPAEKVGGPYLAVVNLGGCWRVVQSPGSINPDLFPEAPEVR